MKTIIYILLSLTIIGVSLGLGLGFGLKTKSKEVNESYEKVSKNNYNKFVMNRKIPKNIFIKINHRDILSDTNNKISNIIKKLGIDFPDYNIKIYDDEESYEEIKLFGDTLLTLCYEEIIPLAYKCDIFRLIVLYNYGGIYLDSGMSLYNIDKLKDLINKNEMILCKDRLYTKKYTMILNGIIISVEKNKFFLKAIENIKHNISNFNYGNTPIDITGPEFLGRIYKKYFNYSCQPGQQFSNIYILNADNNLIVHDNNNNKIASKKKDFLGKSKYKFSNLHYNDLWINKKVFYQLTMCDWHLTAKNYFINQEGELCAHLKNNDGEYVFSSIKYEPNTIFINDNGKFVKV